MFGISLSELIIILLVGFILIGPENMPKLARGLARGMKESKSFISNLQNLIKEEINEVVDEEVVKSVKSVKDIKHNVSPQGLKDKAMDVTGLREVKETMKDLKD